MEKERRSGLWPVYNPWVLYERIVIYNPGFIFLLILLLLTLIRLTFLYSRPSVRRRRPVVVSPGVSRGCETIGLLPISVIVFGHRHSKNTRQTSRLDSVLWFICDLLNCTVYTFYYKYEELILLDHKRFIRHKVKVMLISTIVRYYGLTVIVCCVWRTRPTRKRHKWLLGRKFTYKRRHHLNWEIILSVYVSTSYFWISRIIMFT